MTTALPAIASDPWFIAGWTMVHFLWLGTMVAAIALAGRIVLRSANPNVCYAFALGCLALIAALPIGTATWLVARDGNDNEGLAPLRFAAKPDPAPPITSPNRRDAERSTPATPSSPHTTAPPTIELHVPEGSPPVVVMQPREVVPAAPNEPSFATANSEQPSPSQQRSGNLLAVLVGVIPYLPWVWIIGTPLTFALLATGLLGSRRLRKASRPIQNGPAAELLAHLTLSLRITREITLAACERVAAPVLIGILRPIILLPPAALTGWSPDELEMVLLHELAHVRRYDNLVNFVQRVIESLLFFHPAVWSLSAWVRREREACCDAAVIHRTHKPHAYAELLLNLAATHQPLAGLAIPFSRHPLHTRIRHILQLEEDPMLISGKSFTAIAATLLIIIASAVFYWPPARATEPQPTATPPSKSTPVNREEPPFSRDVERSEPATPANSKFPTSEEQKLSTHVFNRLGMELETLGEEDLKRVKSMGYEGGVKIAIAPQHERSNRNIRFAYGSIQEGDLLVGLHVWPTTSLQDVLTILDRDDLNEFNPMKFYVVRDGSRQPSGSPPVSGDIVEVGRISIPAAPKREQTRESPTPTENTPSNPSATQSQSPPTDSTPALQAPSPSPGKAPKSPSTYDPRPSTAPDRPSAINKESLRYNGKPFQEWQQLWRTELSTENRLEAVKAIAAFGRAGYG
ncbi:MAG: hypothetical protein IT425_08360, partial [Pirellulales bacterium]|nr:hypothetical protein [Pirellulales bacterium]